MEYAEIFAKDGVTDESVRKCCELAVLKLGVRIHLNAVSLNGFPSTKLTIEQRVHLIMHELARTLPFEMIGQYTYS